MIAAILAICVACFTFGADFVFGQEPTAGSPPPKARSTPDVITEAEIDEAVAAIDESTKLDDATKARLKQLYQEAKDSLGQAAEQQSIAGKYQAAIDNAAAELERAQQKKATPPAIELGNASQMELPALAETLSSKQADLTAAKKQYEIAQKEPQRRLTRQTAIPAEMMAARSELELVESQLQATETSEDPPEVKRARKAVLQARKMAAEASIDALEAERVAYEVEAELPRLRSDLALAELRRLEEEVRRLVEILARKKMLDAEEQIRVAKQAVNSASKPLQPVAFRARVSAERRLALTHDLRVASRLYQAVSRQLRYWQDDFERVQQRAEMIKNPAFARSLLERQAKLPSVYSLRTESSKLAASLNSPHRAERDPLADLDEFQRELFELEDRRAALTDLDAAAAETLAELQEQGVPLSEDIKVEVAELLNLERTILDSLLEDARRLYTLRIAAARDRSQLADLVQQYRAFVGENILWLRTAELRDFAHVPQAFAWLLNQSEWTNAVAGFPNRFLAKSGFGQLLGIGMVTLLILSLRFRRRGGQRIGRLGETASTISCRSIRPTVEAVMLTALLALPGALLLWCIGWALEGASESVAAFAAPTCLLVGIALLNAEFLKHACRPKGLAESHLDWPASALSVARRNLRILIGFGLPLALLFAIFYRQHDPLYQASAGRMCLVLYLLVFAFVLYKTLRPSGGIFTGWTAEGDSILRHEPAQRFLWVAAVGTPLLLAALALNGFSYSSYRITVDLWRGLEVVFVLAMVGAVLFRWVHMARRRYRWHQLVESRRRLGDGDESQSKDVDALVAKAEKVDLAAMDQQTRNLIRTILVLIGLLLLWSIWLRDLSAATPLLGIPLWDTDVGGGVVRDVTVGAVLLACFAAIVAVLASKNVPGLVDVMLLGKLGIEASTRYAISTLLQYAIVIGGVLFASALLGASWDRAQWLVAALGVGLGFGLQEVVANFVSGILLLFERPIRVGDVVTLGETTGTVIRIRSRATTVRNWDRQEVVIPNKELITGRITNWTLTDALNRVTIQVGVAYGSDVELASNLLLRIAAEEPNVIEDPKPIVTFDAFGDSTLSLTLRVYLSEVDDRLSTTHSLHSRINQRFQEEGIEIAFPQRDLHIRSMDSSVLANSGDGSLWQEPANPSEH